MASEILSNSGIQIRDNLVTTAVKFLNNPNVQRCTMESKERFLRSKGLTDPEIQKALEKVAESLDLPSMASEVMLYQGRRNLLKDHLIPLIVYGGIAYTCYWFYKNCIRRLLFIEQPKRKSTSECIDELRKSLDVLNANVTSLRGEMQAAHQQSAASTQIKDLKADIASVKGILLNRNQFPSLGSERLGKTRTEPPSIPAWQRQAAGAGEESLRVRSQRSESGGSNSSEEQAAKNSDSSLEIMEKEEPMEMPKRPLSAYMTWLNSERDNIRAQYKGLKVTEIAKLGGELWKSMDKSLYEQKAAIAMEEYNQKMEAYNRQMEIFKHKKNESESDE